VWTVNWTNGQTPAWPAGIEISFSIDVDLPSRLEPQACGLPLGLPSRASIGAKTHSVSSCRKGSYKDEGSIYWEDRRLSMTRTLYANGCSFTAGAELEHEDPRLLGSMIPADRFNPDSAVRKYRRAMAWPSQLGSLIGAEKVINEARSGGSNARTVRLTTNFVGQYLADGGRPGNLLVCVGFTALSRHERFNLRKGAPGADQDAGWELLKPDLSKWKHHGASRASVAANRAYYVDIYSELQAAIIFVQHVLLLQSLLGGLGIPHYFHDALAINDRPLAHWKDTLKNTTQLLRPESHRSVHRFGKHVEFAADQSFEFWLTQSGLKVAPGGHPLSTGHDGWARLIYADMTTIGILR